MNEQQDGNVRDIFSALSVLGGDLLAAAKLLHGVVVTPSPSRMSRDLKHIQSLEESSNATRRWVEWNLDLEGTVGPLSALQAAILFRHLDDAMDAVEEAASFLLAYAVHRRNAPAVKLASQLVRATEELLSCTTEFGGRDKDISPHVRAVAEIENETDKLYRAALSALMVYGTDPLQAMRWKDIYDRLEQAVNRCEEAAQFMGSLASAYDSRPGERHE